MLNDQVSSSEVTDERRHSRVVHRVGHVAHEKDIFPEADHLPDRERPTEHAHIGMDTHDDDILDAMLLKKIVNLFTAVADRVLGRNFQGCDLALPRTASWTLRMVIAAAVGVIDGQRALLGQIQGSPGFKRGWGFNFRRLLSSFPLRSLFVEVHRAARRMNDEDTPLARFLDHLVHARCQFADTSSRPLAPMLIPHIADDDGCFLWLPLNGFFDSLELAAAFACLHSAARMKLECLGPLGGEVGRKKSQ